MDQPAAEEGSDGDGNPAQPGPRSDRRGPVIGIEGRLEDGEAPGHEQRRAASLQRSGRDEQGGRLRERAQHRGRREPHHADDEGAPPAEAVAERAAEEQEGGECQGVGVDDPLQIREARAEIVGDPRQGEVDHGGVDRREAGSQHGGEQNPPAGRRGIPEVGCHVPAQWKFGTTRPRCDWFATRCTMTQGESTCARPPHLWPIKAAIPAGSRATQASGAWVPFGTSTYVTS